MIDKLIKYGIKKETIESIKEIDSLEYNLEVNLEEIIKIIDYLKSIKINSDVIDKILSYMPDLFLKSEEEIEELFNKKDVNELVNSINDCYINIDLLFD